MLNKPLSTAESILPRRSRNGAGRIVSLRTIRMAPPRSVTNRRVESDTGAVRYVGRKKVPTAWSIGVPGGGGGGGGGVGGIEVESPHAASTHSRGNRYFTRAQPPRPPDAGGRGAEPRSARGA